MSRQPLEEVLRAADNRVMVETAEQLRAALMQAWMRWHAQDTLHNSKAAMARALQERTGDKCTPQTVNGWFSTGRMDKKWIGPVEDFLDCSLGFSRPAQAQDLRLDGYTVPPLITKEELMNEDHLVNEFRFAIEDDALAPEHPRDTEFIWSRTKPPTFQSLILVKDKHGQLHAREYRQGRAPGQWLAASTNRAFASFDSAEDQLQVLAVAVYRQLP